MVGYLIAIAIWAQLIFFSAEHSVICFPSLAIQTSLISTPLFQRPDLLVSFARDIRRYLRRFRSEREATEKRPRLAHRPRRVHISVHSAVFSAGMPITSFQPRIVGHGSNCDKVVNRFAIATGAVIMILAGIFRSLVLCLAPHYECQYLAVVP